MSEPIHVCRGVTSEQWKELKTKLDHNDPAAWTCAIEIFERRMRERFLNGIEALIAADSRKDVATASLDPSGLPALPGDDGKVVVPGFAVMALCCLFVETLQSFREKTVIAPPPARSCGFPEGKCIKPGSTTTDQFKKFLKRPAFRNAFADDALATSFVRGIRNGILHEAETRGWVIWRDRPPGCFVGTHGDGHALNRSEFFTALKSEFENYLEELRDSLNAEQRKRFIEKMSDIAKEC